MNTSRWKRKAAAAMGKGLLAGMAAVSLIVPAGPAEAAVPETIRVALYADIGSKYKSTVPAVTLESNSEWSVGTGGVKLVTVPASSRVRFSLDSYRVKVMETPVWQTAADAAKKLQTGADRPLLFYTSKSGQTVYQLYTGSYASEAAANEAASRVARAGLSIPAGQAPAPAGPKHLSAGTYASLQDATAARGDIAAAGFDAWTVITSASGTPAYEVWVGEEANDASLAALRTSLVQALPGLNVSEGATLANGLIVRADAGLDLSAEIQTFNYMVAGGSSFVASGNASGLQVTERSKRLYRGDLELGALNGSLSVVNVVPVEQYLYSVVGGEVPSSWPEEALKAQAVSARSYALFASNRFDVADVVDTTLSQVYNGIGAEAPSITKAVDATAGEVLMNGGRIVEAVFSSNSGGTTADPSEVWGNPADALASVASPTDSSASAANGWYYVLLKDGTTGYVREDNAKLTGTKTGAGLDTLTATTANVNVRPLPMIQSDSNPVGRLNPGDQATVLNKVPESGSYSWIRGPYTSAELLKSLQGKVSGTLPASIDTLEVTKRGPSGRATEVQANGSVLAVRYPDLFRSAFGGLPSTLFDIVPVGGYTVQGANGSSTVKGTAGVISASGTVTGNVKGQVVMGADGAARAVSSGNAFLFVGYGNGHGLGMSQWGVKGLADQGYDYRQILQHYYHNVTISKE